MGVDSEKTRLVLVRRQKCLYTPVGETTGGRGCYTRSLKSESCEWETAGGLQRDEHLLCRLDDKVYPWVVNGFTIPNMHLARFEVVPGASSHSRARREVYMDLSGLR